MAKTPRTDDDDVITFKVRVAKKQNPKAYEWAESLSWGMFPKFVNDVLTLYANKGYLLANDWILENDTKSIELLERSQNQQANANGVHDLLVQMQQMQEQMMFLQKQLQMQQAPMGFGYFPQQGFMNPYTGHSPLPQHGQAHTQQVAPHNANNPQTDAQQQQDDLNAVASAESVSETTQAQEEEYSFILPPMVNDSSTENTSLGGFGAQSEGTQSDTGEVSNFSGFALY